MKHILLFIFTVLLSLPSYGSVVIMGTRVIYPAEQKSINVRLNNGDSTPSLIQAWLDTGDPSSPPDSVRVVYYYASCFPGGAAFRTDNANHVYGRKSSGRQGITVLAECFDITAKPSFAESVKKHRDIITFSCRTKPD